MEESHQIYEPVASEPSKDPSKLVQPHNPAERCGEENTSSSFGNSYSYSFILNLTVTS